MNEGLDARRPEGMPYHVAARVCRRLTLLRDWAQVITPGADLQPSVRALGIPQRFGCTAFCAHAVLQLAHQ